jgi:hypothetical protein
MSASCQPLLHLPLRPGHKVHHLSAVTNLRRRGRERGWREKGEEVGERGFGRRGEEVRGCEEGRGCGWEREGLGGGERVWEGGRERVWDGKREERWEGEGLGVGEDGERKRV